jgi:hypothetical protein
LSSEKKVKKKKISPTDSTINTEMLNS